MQLEINSAASGCFLLIYIKKRKIKLTNRHNLVTMSATAVIFLLKAELGRNVTMRLNAAGWHHRPLIVCQLRNTNIGGWPKSLKGGFKMVSQVNSFCTKNIQLHSNKVDNHFERSSTSRLKSRNKCICADRLKNNQQKSLLLALQSHFGHLLQNQLKSKKST